MCSPLCSVFQCSSYFADFVLHVWKLHHKFHNCRMFTLSENLDKQKKIGQLKLPSFARPDAQFDKFQHATVEASTSHQTCSVGQSTVFLVTVCVGSIPACGIAVLLVQNASNYE